ncbi:MAG TPA: L,D-transpeptidase family protein [Gammaproteobacteria bacterium]|nr:L,D-transpeptidase family protein [Gammaproteobacteria bacterium]
MSSYSLDRVPARRSPLRAFLHVLLLFATVAQISPGAANEAAPTREALAAALAAGGAQLVVDGVRLWSTPVLRRLYAETAPAWSARQLEVLRANVAAVTSDGLEPADFLARELAELDRHAPVARELIATEALARLAFVLRFGKANPNALEPDWNYTRAFGATDPVRWLREAIPHADLSALLNALRPHGSYYRGLVAALADMRAIAAQGGWPAVPTGDTLKPGMRDARVAALRTRLAVELPLAASEDPTLYDDALVTAVTLFQRDHGLAADAAVGRATLAALNLPVAARIDQIRVNLERIRWVYRDLGREFVAVNIAGYEAAYLVDGSVRWRGRAIVGRPYRQTPIFRDELVYLELNPTWTVPPTIFREDFLPKLRRNPGFLREKKLRVVDPNGGPVNAASIDWRQVRASSFPYYLRQDPGPDNALGRIKFMFPNDHAVYLHDTPARELFAQPERSFSSGCIRIEKPLELAEQLLRDPTRWNVASLQAAIGTLKTQRVNLPQRVPILLLYLTAFPDEHGRVQFRRDVYGRDAAVLAALAAPPAWTPPSDFDAPGSSAR